MKAADVFRAFADWRLQTFARRPRESVRFFRSSLDHSMVWMLVMRGHFNGNPPTVGECQDIARCSRLTTRKLIADAVSKGLLQVHPAADDHRKRIVRPSERTIAEYESMVRGYISFFEEVGRDRSGERPAQADAERAAAPAAGPLASSRD